MEKRIYKYKLEIRDKQAVELPKGSVILTVQAQYNIPCLWAEVDALEENWESRHIEVYGTGSLLASDAGEKRRYISTFQMDGGTFIGHVYERID